jgi:hypothetical protein
LIAEKTTHVTDRGTLFYKIGQDVFRDNDGHVSLRRDVSDDGMASALRIAMAKFNGKALTVNGSDALKAKCVEAAVREGLRLIFSDPDMERERRQRLRDVADKDYVLASKTRSHDSSRETMRMTRQKLPE